MAIKNLFKLSNPAREKESNYHQFEAVFDFATIGMVIVNSDGVITNFNKFAEQQFGYGKDEVIGGTVEMLLPGPITKRHVGHREGFVKSPTNRPMGSGRDLFAKRKDGTVFPVEISLSHYTRNNESYVIAFIIDITVRKNNEIALKESTDRIQQINVELEQKVDGRTKMLRETLAELEGSKEELNEALKKERELGDLKSRFVTLASHEFRTPLSTILSSASLIDKYLKEEEHPKRKKHVDRIKEAVGNMRDILEDFLSLGKLEEGQIDVNMEELTNEQLRDDLSRVVASMEQLTKPGQKISVECSVTSSVKLDRKLTGNIISNLLSNAIKFSPDHSEIFIRCKSEKKLLSIEVQDSGIGISEEDQKHLFERFFRAKNAANIQGTGLGLNIVVKYLELMGGRILCNSDIDEGTTFTVQIPQ
ncbi:MAG: PAS domain S-box protein [Cyclobacteriaceae bacterium]|nr:PAS domain S-box protein [Cyclobacteriaceae bacterium]